MPDCPEAGILTGRVEEELLTPADPQLAATRRILMGSNEDRTEEEEGQIVSVESADNDGGHRVGAFEALNGSTAAGQPPNLLAVREPQRPFYLVDGAPSTQAHISSASWAKYQRFKEDTCRKGRLEEDLAERSLNSTESDYFHWEQNQFHRELRDRLLPQTRGGTFHSLIGSPLLSRLDPRLFASEPRSLCKAKRHTSEVDERQKLAKEEQHMFEDFLINKVLPVEMFAPRHSATGGNGTRRA